MIKKLSFVMIPKERERGREGGREGGRKEGRERKKERTHKTPWTQLKVERQ